MLMRPDVVNNCIEKNQNDNPIIYLSPKGDKLDTSLVKQFAQQAGINILCGHFEGVDQRVIEKIISKKLVLETMCFLVEKAQQLLC